MTKLIFRKATMLGLIGMITLGASVVSANTHQREKDPQDARPSGCQVDSGFYATQGCAPTHPIDLPTRDRDPISGRCNPTRLTMDVCSSSYLPYEVPSEWVRRRNQDNGLPPCGIVYNGPCDSKKGI
jgi:hypothetical protein